MRWVELDRVSFWQRPALLTTGPFYSRSKRAVPSSRVQDPVPRLRWTTPEKTSNEMIRKVVGRRDVSFHEILCAYLRLGRSMVKGLGTGLSIDRAYSIAPST